MWRKPVPTYALTDFDIGGVDEFYEKDFYKFKVLKYATSTLTVAVRS